MNVDQANLEHRVVIPRCVTHDEDAIEVPRAPHFRLLQVLGQAVLLEMQLGREDQQKTGVHVRVECVFAVPSCPLRLLCSGVLVLALDDLR